MDVNPFHKQAFSSYREWEEALVLFLAEQLKAPDVNVWEKLVDDNEARHHAAFMSLYLANVALVRKAEQEDTLRKVFPLIMKYQPSVQDYKSWLSSAWVDYNRLTPALKFAVDQNFDKSTHRLLA